jgi:hypothetical protein
METRVEKLQGDKQQSLAAVDAAALTWQQGCQLLQLLRSAW